MKNTRKYTNAIMVAIDAGMLDAEQVLLMALSYMSEYDVQDMCEANEIVEVLFPEECEEEND